jgi:DNA-binding CsgD family transcriptional regulator/tetratricopeptide (TPR) repeat protein
LSPVETTSERSPFELYSEGRLDACLRQSAGATSIAERILRVRALIRKNDHLAALDTIASIERAAPQDEVLLLALKSSCHSYRGEPDLARAALAAARPGKYDLEVRFELAYARVLIAWVESDPDAMYRALHEIDVRHVPSVYGRWLYASSWVASLRGQYHEQLRLLERAADHISSAPEAQDLFLLTKTIRAISHLVQEIYAKETFAFAVRMVETLPWNEELEAERFLTLRGLAWAYALRGMHQKAFEYAYSARDIAPSSMWVTSSYCDQAYLARMAGESRSADALLDHAVACAKETDWSTRGEERLSLLNIAELAADRDPATAREILAIYDAIQLTVEPALALAHDARLSAMEAYARGVVFAVSGDRRAAIDQLTSAYEAFCSIGYAWRAAAAALRIHAVTAEDAWLRYASEAVAEFTESSVAEEIRKRAAGAVVDPRVAALTPAQRRVFALLCEGLGDKEIAQRLGISRETVKNHAVRVRAAFGVHSRAALIASTRSFALAV